MLLHVVLPGLLWPKDSLREATRDLRTPALATLIGRGRVDWQPALPFEHWLCRAFGIAAAEPPCAALRLSGEGIEPGGHAWICADPVHLRFARGTLIIGSPGELDLSLEEAAQLVAALNEHLGHIGEFLAPQPGRWYLRLKHVPRVVTHPLSAVIGRPVEAFLPQGAEAQQWRHIINEAQVLLHNHPLNVAREEAGRPTANSLWPWGAGVLPAAVVAADTVRPELVPQGLPAVVEGHGGTSPRSGFDRLSPNGVVKGRSTNTAMYSDHPLARGLARLAGLPCHAVPQAGVPKEGFVLLEGLADAAHALDLHAWRDKIAEMEQRWFQPLLAALKSGQLKQLRLTALGDEGIADVTVEAGQLWKFWRRPLPLETLVR